MSLAKIKQLRSERSSKLGELEQQRQKLANDRTLSNIYKVEKDNEVKIKIQAVKTEYDSQISELIDQTENKLLQGFHNAEYEGLKGEQATIELLKEMRNQKKTDQLVELYRGKDETQFRDFLHGEAERLIGVNSPEAKAYLDAMKLLGVSDIDGLENKYKQQNQNDLQKSYQDDLALIKEQKDGFRFDVFGDPFLAGFDSVR